MNQHLGPGMEEINRAYGTLAGDTTHQIARHFLLARFATAAMKPT